jgi:hypothetical protein
MLSEKEVLAEMVRLIENVGLLNLINGVQLGATSWYVKMSDCMESAKAVLAEREQPPVQPAGDVDDYVAWLCWRGNDSHRHLVLCDSDADGAFKVYRKPKGNREFIGTLRARLMAPFDCPWNGLVRDITAADETSGELCDPTAVMQALIASICERAYLDHSFPERQHSGLLGLFAQADRPRTPAERVTIKLVSYPTIGDRWQVLLDGKIDDAFGEEITAKRYAAGLRAEING